MSHVNNPVIGDKLYGFKKNIFSKVLKIYNAVNNDFKQYLHSYSLSFFDPETNKKKIYKATYPEKYLLLLNALKKNKNDKKI